MHPPQTGGVFAQDSNLIYELARYFPYPRRSFTLRIENQTAGKELSSTIRTMEPAYFVYPEQFWVDRGKFNLTDQNRPFVVHYGATPASVLTVSIKYVDIMYSGDTICRKANHSDPPLFLPLIGSPQYENGREFTLNDWWLLFNRSIPDDPQVNFRQFYRFDFTLWTGDSAIAKYYDVANRFTDNRRQSFSNIEGGMGLFFAASHAKVTNVEPHEKFHLFLSTNDTTAHLKFLSHPFRGTYTDPDSSLVNPFFTTLR
jgi:hypothetical protein